MDQQKPPTLFVSHPSSKADTALHIERALNARGVNCWIAPRDIEPGEQWDIAIRRSIADTDAMLLLFCADSERSKQVKRELILADNSHKAIIPMRLERIEPHELSYHLADSQWIDWIEQRDEAIDRIAAKAREFRAERLAADAAGGTPASATPEPSRAYQPSPAAYSGSGGVAPPSFPPPYQAPPPARGERRPGINPLVWVAVGGVALIAIITVTILLISRGGSTRTLTEEWFAGTWSESRDCREMYRFDRSGSVTDPNGNQGRWFVEENNMLVVEGLAGTERRRVEIISDDQVTGPDGNAYRCFAGAT